MNAIKIILGGLSSFALIVRFNFGQTFLFSATHYNWKVCATKTFYYDSVSQHSFLHFQKLGEKTHFKLRKWENKDKQLNNVTCIIQLALRYL